MGSRSPQKVKDEIGSIRSRLDETVTELEKRVPPMVSAGKRIAIALAGGTGGTLMLFVWRRLRSFSRSRNARKPMAPPSSVAVQVLPPGAVPIAVVLAAVWAGVRLYEARLRSSSATGTQTTADVRRLRSTGS